VTDPEHLDVDYLDVEDLLGMIRRLRVGPVCDLGLLDAACARPRASAFGQDAYPTVVQKAAAFLESLVGSHPLVDGNERLGWLATTVLLTSTV
jgi:death on curing protein